MLYHCLALARHRGETSGPAWLEATGVRRASARLVLAVEEGRDSFSGPPRAEVHDNTAKPVLNGPLIKGNFVLNGNIFRSRDYHSIP
jgi:hypothetical protein